MTPNKLLVWRQNSCFVDKVACWRTVTAHYGRYLFWQKDSYSANDEYFLQSTTTNASKDVRTENEDREEWVLDQDKVVECIASHTSDAPAHFSTSSSDNRESSSVGSHSHGKQNPKGQFSCNSGPKTQTFLCVWGRKETGIITAMTYQVTKGMHAPSALICP